MNQEASICRRDRRSTSPIGILRLAVLAVTLLFPTAALAQSSANPGVVEISDPGRYSQVLAISDVHGMYAHLRTLLKAARVLDGAEHWAAGRSLMVVVGDSIDKGPETVPVLELWMRLHNEAEAKGGRLVVLLGNHEAEFLRDPNRTKASLFCDELTRAHINPALLAAGKDPRGIGNFLRAMPIAARVGKYLFAHAGWYPPGTTWPEFMRQAKRALTAGGYAEPLIVGEHSILEEKEVTPPGADDPVKWYDDAPSVRDLETRIAGIGLYGVVFGHQPKAFHYRDQIGGVDGLHLIKIDTGMAPDADASPGEILRFSRPADLLRQARPTADRLLADGSTAAIDDKQAAAKAR